MKLKIAGGCGEHGRNCFYVEQDDYSFLVDCGLMADDKENPYPNLTNEEISRLRYIFLTHSHLDHTGALPWVLSQGFNGIVVASKETLSQLPFNVENTLALEDLSKNLDGLMIEYGRSGHCVGSVWYLFEYKEKRIFFSGDYTENTICYKYDEIKNMCADLAVIDCAYGYDEHNYGYYYQNIVNHVKELMKKYSTVLMPVPKYGRGIELYYLLKKEIPELIFSGDRHFINQVTLLNQNKYWFKEEYINDSSEINTYSQRNKANILFVSHPQLKTEETKQIAKEVIKNNFALMTGTVEKGTMSYELLQENKMILCRYPIHLNYIKYSEVVRKNDFKRVIAYHCPDIIPECKEYIF